MFSRQQCGLQAGRLQGCEEQREGSHLPGWGNGERLRLCSALSWSQQCTEGTAEGDKSQHGWMCQHICKISSGERVLVLLNWGVIMGERQAAERAVLNWYHGISKVVKDL